MAFRSERRGRYSCANAISKSLAEDEQSPHRRVAAADGPLPTLSSEDIQLLCRPVGEVLSRSTCYDAMGLSTQVVVIEVHSPLTVAFIAAQETKVPQCVLWNAAQREFAGVLPSTEYIKILLYCHDNPQYKDTVTQMTIDKWLEMTESVSFRPSVVVAVTATDSLADCLGKMTRHKVRRSLIIAEKESNDFSLVGIITHESILQHLVLDLFSLDTSSSEFGSIIGTSSEGSSGTTLLPQRVRNIVLGLSPGADNAIDAGSPVAVGPYRDIFDVPFSQIPDLGVNRSQPHSVTMSTPVVEALRLLIEKRLHSIAVVDDAGIVIDVVSRSDVMRMETNGMYDVTMTVAEAISFHVGGNIFVFHETDTIRDILIHFAQCKVREMYLVNPHTDQLMGQLSMSDLLKFLHLGGPTPAET